MVFCTEVGVVAPFFSLVEVKQAHTKEVWALHGKVLMVWEVHICLVEEEVEACSAGRHVVGDTECVHSDAKVVARFYYALAGESSTKDDGKVEKASVGKRGEEDASYGTEGKGGCGGHDEVGAVKNRHMDEEEMFRDEMEGGLHARERDVIHEEVNGVVTGEENMEVWEGGEQVMDND